jgi:hypothetical protein
MNAMLGRHGIFSAAFRRFGKLICRNTFLVLLASSWPIGAEAGTGDFSARNIGGIYALGAITYGTFKNINGLVDPGVARNSSVAGLYQRYNWNDIETDDGIYDWSVVDNDVALAAAAGKKVAMSVVPGAFSPDWLYSEGTAAFSFVWNTSWGYPACTVQRMPLPWDPTFITKWEAFVRVFGARYDTNPNVVQVKLTGFNSLTPELFLPSSVNQPINVNGVTCTSFNDVANWQAAGYTRTKAETTWNGMATAFFLNFPNTPIAAMMEPADFPPIDQNGNRLAVVDGEDDQANTDVIDNSIALYGRQFILQNDGLSPGWIWQLEKSYSSQIHTGYQMVNFVMGTDLSGAVTLALTAGPEFLEMSTHDLDNPLLAPTVILAAGALP